MERLRPFISEAIGQDVAKFVARRYKRDGYDSVEIAQELGNLTGRQPTPQTVRNWVKDAGVDLRDPKERGSASYMWTEKPSRGETER